MTLDNSTIVINMHGLNDTEDCMNCFKVSQGNQKFNVVMVKDGVQSARVPFRHLRDVNDYMVSNGGVAVLPENVGLINCFDKTGKFPCDVTDDYAYILIPQSVGFSVFYRNRESREFVSSGARFQCVSAMRSHANKRLRGGDSCSPKCNTKVEYFKADGAVSEKQGHTYRLEKYAETAAALYYLKDGVNAQLAFGDPEQCRKNMWEHIAACLSEAVPPEVEEAAARIVTEAGKVTPERKTHQAVYSRYFSARMKDLGDVYVEGARYRVYKTVKGIWRAGEYNSVTHKSNWIDSLEFEDEDQATAYLYLYAGSKSLEFYDDYGKKCTFRKATKCIRTTKTGHVERHSYDGYSWNKEFVDGVDVRSAKEKSLAAKTASAVKQPVDAKASGNVAEMAVETPVGEESKPPAPTTQVLNYYSASLQLCSRADAMYREACDSGNCQVHQKVDGKWKSIFKGTLEQLTSFKDKLIQEYLKTARAASQSSSTKGASKGEAAPVEKQAADGAAESGFGEISAEDNSVVSVVWSKCRYTTWLSEKQLYCYLVLAAIRNRYAGKSAMFDTRLYDGMKQPIYLVDTDWVANPKRVNTSIRKGCLKACDSLAEARCIRSDIQDVPRPLQWSDNVSEYMWDPTTPIAPITLHAIEHIVQERGERFPEELKGKDEVAVMEVVKKAAVDGAMVAARDPFYALPAYSKEHNDVTLMLPVYIPLLYGNKVIAALVVKKWATGYRVVTMLDTVQAVRSVSLFRDPRTTWLKEAYEEWINCG